MKAPIAAPARGDARAQGQEDVLASRQDPGARARCGLARLGAMSPLRRRLLRWAARSPFPLGRRVDSLRGARDAAGSWDALEEEFARSLPVLLYHHVGPRRPGTPASLSISPRDFELQIELLARAGYTGIRPAQWLAWLREARPLPKKPILLTFDDGYADTAEHALPVLQRRGFGACLFIVTGELGGTNSWDEAKGAGTLRLMTAERIRFWSRQGFEFGAHTRKHRDLTRLNAEDLRAEVAGSADDLAALLGARPSCFAYSYGYCDANARRSAEDAFALAFTIEAGLNTLATDPLMLKRTGVKPGAPGLDFRLRARFGRNPFGGLRKLLRPFGGG